MPKTLARTSVVAAVFGGFVISAPAFAQDCCPAKYGANDEIGAANLLTPEVVKKAAQLVKVGKVYRLGIETNSKTPAFPPRTFSVTIVQPGQEFSGTIGSKKLTYNDDIITGWVGIGSQLDGLGHIGIDGVYYGNRKAKDFAKTTGLTALGMEKVPAFVARGVLLDMAAYYKTDVLKEGTAFNSKEIEEQAKAQGVTIQKGDVVIFHTGWLSLIDKDPKRYGSGEPGLGVEGARYLASKEVVAVGADTWGLDPVPFEKDAGVFETHQVLIPRNGIYILENMNTAPLVADRAWEFMFVLGVARITGAVQSIINPVAIR